MDPLWKKYDELLKTLHAYQAAVNVAAIVSVTDIQGKIIYANDKFTEISKYSLSELIGQTHRIINSGHHSREFFCTMWQTISKGKHWRGQIKNKAKDGTYYWVDTVITPVLDKNNKILQYLSVRNLITLQKENEEKLARIQEELLKREQQLNEAQEVAKTGSWYIDTASNTIEWSKEAYRIFEIPDSINMTYEKFLEMVHPDDREQIDRSWQAAIKGAPYEIDHRIVTASGVKWVRERAHLEFDASAALTGAIGTVQDITEKKKIEDTVRQSEILYKNLFNYSAFPIGIIDRETLRFLEVNETATQLYGYSREEFLQMTAYDIRIPEEHRDMEMELKNGKYSIDIPFRSHKKKNGEIIHIEPFARDILYKGSHAFLITIHDVTEKLKIQEQLIQARLTHQKEIGKASLEAQEKNRAEIGRELHDNINQLLVASNLYLKNIRTDSARDKELLDKSLELTQMAIQEIRKLSWSMVSPSVAGTNLKESLENLSTIFQMTDTHITFDIRVTEDSIPEALKINIYRIIQEQFNNIIKYAEATKVKVTLIRQENKLILVINDNGKGFDINQKPKGIGLTNIIYRAELYQGNIQIDSKPGQGCTIQIEFSGL